jgi:hypothetical protein
MDIRVAALLESRSGIINRGGQDERDTRISDLKFEI